MFVKVTDGTPTNYSVEQLRRDNPHLSFPDPMPNDVLAEWGVYPLKRTPRPSYNDLTHGVRVVDPIEVNGEWVQQWEVFPRPSSVQLSNLHGARAAAYAAEADPLFFEWQAGESTEAKWRAKREEIRARYPYPAPE